MELTQIPFLIFDGQTTGLPPQGELLEIGWSIGTAELEIETRLIRPAETAAIPRKVWELTGLTPEALVHQRNVEDVWEEFIAALRRLPEGAIVVIHYAQFEAPYLNAIHERLFGQAFPWRILCSSRVARKLYPNLPSWSLRSMSGFFGATLSEVHRARDHVAATQRIWKGICDELVRREIATLDDLDKLLAGKTTRARSGRREFLVEAKTRLSIENVPGIYEMLSREGRVLYVGKATSLRDRVNSYFRGKRSDRSQLPELLSQVCDVRVTPTATPFEAALLETERIRELQPPYNRLLKGPVRPLLFLSTDLMHYSVSRDKDHPYGPFSSTIVFEEVVALSQVPEGTVDTSLLFFDKEYSAEAIATAMASVAARITGAPVANPSPEVLLQIGKRLARVRTAEESHELFGEGNEEDEVSEATALFQSVARKLRRAAQAIRQSGWLNRLGNCVFAMPLTAEGKDWRVFRVCGGSLDESFTINSIDDISAAPAVYVPAVFDSVRYDRIKLLLSEIQNRFNRKKKFVLKISDLYAISKPRVVFPFEKKNPRQ